LSLGYYRFLRMFWDHRTTQPQPTHPLPLPPTSPLLTHSLQRNNRCEELKNQIHPNTPTHTRQKKKTHRVPSVFVQFLFVAVQARVCF
jgi:hypothetical protein